MVHLTFKWPNKRPLPNKCLFSNKRPPLIDASYENYFKLIGIGKKEQNHSIHSVVSLIGKALRTLLNVKFKVRISPIQTDATLLDVTCCVRCIDCTPCCILWSVVGSCIAKFETDGQTFSYVQTDGTTPNIVGPTMLWVDEGIFHKLISKSVKCFKNRRFGYMIFLQGELLRPFARSHRLTMATQ